MKKKIKAFFLNFPTQKIKARELAVKLKITSVSEYESMKHFLHQLEKEGFVQRSGKRYSFCNLGTGKISGTLTLVNGGSYGFVVTDDKAQSDIFISQRNLGTALQGDKVEISLFAKQRGKNLEGEIINVISRNKNEFIGTLKKSKSFYFVQPQVKEMHRDIYVPKEHLNGAVDGDRVVVNSIEWSSPLLNPEGKIKEVLGKSGSYETEIVSIAREFDLPYKFPDSVISESEKIPLAIPESEIKTRLDLRNKNVFTIDPEDAKDFDDAVSIEKLENGNWNVGVHIADVSHYIDKSSDIYEEALNRGNSVYFVGKVIPMLPERLSNNICSLVPYEDRLTFSVIFEMTGQGKIVSYIISKTVINSKKRFSYEGAQEILDKKKGDFYDELFQLNKIAKNLRKTRMKNGSINFNTPEVKFELDDNGIPLNITIKKLLDTNNLIEEYMLLANQTVTKHVNSDNQGYFPFIYRVHDLPDTEKITEFARFVKSLGFSFDPNAVNKSKQFQILFDNVKDTEEEAIINEVAIRSMAKAFYSTNNIGHYGLGFSYYSHFTSPIRRFADLAVHMQLFRYLNKKLTLFDNKKLEKICEHISAQERKAVNAERHSVKLKQIEYLRNKIGYEFFGVISGITNFGFFVQLKHNLSDGLVRLSDLDDDYYIYDEKKYSLVGKRTKKTYRLGDKVNVKVARVDSEKKEIDFLLLEKL
jgi:ribonuclease R